MENRIHSIGVFIDGGYYAKMDEGLRKSSGVALPFFGQSIIRLVG